VKRTTGFFILVTSWKSDDQSEFTKIDHQSSHPDSTDTGVNMSDVALIDYYYYESIINLIVRELKSQRVFTISQRLECPQNDCRWVLIDINFFIDRMNIKTIEDYCGCTNKKKTIDVALQHF
jgi:hypothetical protein